MSLRRSWEPRSTRVGLGALALRCHGKRDFHRTLTGISPAGTRSRGGGKSIRQRLSKCTTRRRGKNKRNKKPYAPLSFLVAQGLLIKQSLSGCSQSTLSRDQPVASCTSRQAKEHSRLRLPHAWPIPSVYGMVTQSPLPRVHQGNS